MIIPSTLRDGPETCTTFMVTACGVFGILLFMLAAPISTAASPQQATSGAPQAAAPARTWVGADGEPTAFSSHEEVREFLRTAEIIEVEEVGEGITRPRRILLESDGIRMHAIFHDVRLTEEERRVGDRFYWRFHDRYQGGVAAYVLARMLTIDGVPPTVLRSVEGTEGSLQLWLEGTFTEEERAEDDLSPPHALRWVQDLQEMRFFDNLVFNPDRHAGNILMDRDWNVWLIDHTRAFQPVRELLDAEQIHSCRRVLWERLNALTEGELRGALGSYVESEDISALIERRALLIEYIEGLIAQRGEAAVLY